MKDIDIYRDLLYFRISGEVYYNRNIIDIRNPEVRQLFTQLRDDEMRAVVKLQQKIEKLEASPGIVAKIFPAKAKLQKQ
ncbi:MAG: hypothetical protein FIA99_06175 [Ruminiclostridium sp.]|nr:hypothetical protein [Ruminiclostridium sp.]